jgi:orotidine-5'-phosphate decarboxylase
MEAQTVESFGIRLAAQVGKLGNPVVLGLDPNPGLIPKTFFSGQGAASADGVLRFCTAVLDAISGLVPVVKLQSAYFEMFGPEGIRAMQAAASEASSRGFLVIVDVKRGDIGETSAAYAEAYLGPNAFIQCDAMTLNPYLGWDSLEPFFRVALEQNKGVFVCAQTSNPGARDLQSALAGGKPV